MLLSSRAAAGQDTGWHSVIEASASTLFGASAQTLTALTTSLSHNGEGFTADAAVKFRYGESQDEERNTFVSSRGWSLTTSVDVFPEGRFSPFLFASAEASLEKRIAGRQSGGAGAKWVFARSNTGAASVSAAILGERTAALSDTLPTRHLVRWSWRAKTQHRVAERLTFSHVTFYAPVFNAPADFTITSTTVGSVDVTRTLALSLTFTDNYDSQARARGAPTNNDGSLMFGFRASF